jgi:peroxiredoxin
LCRQQVADLARHERQFIDKNSRLVVIGPGESQYLRGFREATGYRLDLFADPTRRSFQILGFSSGIGRLIGMKQIKRVLSALRAGHRPGSLQGNALQLGGAAIIETDATIRLLIKEEQAGDHPPVSILLDALT